MFVTKAIPHVSHSDKVVELCFDNSVNPKEKSLKKATYMCNVNANGCLRPLGGLKKALDVDINVIDTFVHDESTLLIISHSGNLYKVVDGTATLLQENVGKYSFARAYSDGNVTVFSSDNGTYSFDGSSLTEIADYCFTSVTVAGERLVGVSEDKVYFSSAGDFTSWDADRFGSFYLKISGAEKVTECDGNVFVFTRCAVYKVALSSDSQNVKVGKVYEGNVSPQTASCFNKSVVFVGDNHVVKIGNGVSYLFGELKDLLSNTSQGLVIGSKYFVSCNTVEFGGKMGCERFNYSNNSLFTFDFIGNSYTLLRGYDVVALANINGNVAVVSGGNVNTFTDDAVCEGKSMWVSSVSMGWATLKNIRISAKGNVDVTVKSNDGCRIYHVFDGGTLPVKASGDYFTVMLEGCLQVDSVKLQFTSYGGTR